MKAVFLDLKTLDQEDLELSALKSLADEWVFHDLTAADETAERIRDVEIVITNKVVIDAALMDQAENLKLICVAATGTNNVDLEAAKEMGIMVTNVTGYGTPSVVQHVFAMLLALNTSLIGYHERVQAGAWQKSSSFCLFDLPITELTGKRMGIIGYGELGQGVATVAEAFGMQLMIAQRPGSTEAQPNRYPLDEVLQQADVISLHVPLADNTANLIGERELKMMKPDAVVINTARGGIVDEEALVDALKSGEIGAAGFDVLSVEPPKQGNVLLDNPMPNLIVTPHVAWASQQSRQRLLNLVVESIENYIADASVRRRLV
ncbi:2-hydroxyacid dehydrogenase [Solemya elarraichensis gill symbiont]|uniref:Glycerate dehydrogenase n=1 Tax=Solemya elarraichensis gill symbiont TaxID=1918949 RepID=A0A1T2LCE3_9GAMM|nr:2-hydroxyacid dehydrogenase [Solemya elarraichensis gill symbiont]OOZ42714.1 glycerate dehydrogenase [Solemya elarraichensis gill symbiont]